MNRFVDETVIEVASGNGGSGSVHFRREKYIPKGGPDGGDGGCGGDVVFLVKRNLKTLSSLRHRRLYRAENGKPGGGQRSHGKGGADVRIDVPPGTLVKDFENKQLIRDLSSEDEAWTYLTGGKGGQGNWHYRSATNHTPHFAQEGRSGQNRTLLLELNLIADLGLVGLPNAGKSTLLSVLTNARPKIGSYPFTTKNPNIGVVRYYDHDLVLADIPGIIAGASAGAGLGLKFLKHIGRTRILVFLLDLGAGDPAAHFRILVQELDRYRPDLLQKPRLLVGTKLDLDEAARGLEVLKRGLTGEQIVAVSAHSRVGIDELKKTFGEIVDAGNPRRDL